MKRQPIANNNEYFKNVQDIIKALAISYEIEPKKILEIGILTHISNQILPNYKHYNHIISGITQARMIKGRSGKYAIVNNIELLEKNYDLSSINKNILDRAMDLVITTFDSIYENGTDEIKRAYNQALNDPEFLFINLNLSVKILGEHLLDNDMKITNKTLEYMTRVIKDQKENLAKKIIDAYVSGVEENIKEAKKEYFKGMDEFLQNYFKSLNISIKDAEQFSMEQRIVKRLGENFFNNLILGLLIEMKEEVLENNHLQRHLKFNKNNLIK